MCKFNISEGKKVLIVKIKTLMSGEKYLPVDFFLNKNE